MNIVRSLLRDNYGDGGMLAADLHYAVDYIERWLDPELSKWMLIKMQQRGLYPPKRWDFVHRYKRIWYQSAREQNTIPITAYCNMCKGIMRPINSPFCNECFRREIFREKCHSILSYKHLQISLRSVK
ncbi:MAG: hypothetical protein QXW55_06125 [Candidatus Bathyarchaeia archaeon]